MPPAKMREKGEHMDEEEIIREQVRQHEAEQAELAAEIAGELDPTGEIVQADEAEIRANAAALQEARVAKELVKLNAEVPTAPTGGVFDLQGSIVTNPQLAVQRVQAWMEGLKTLSKGAIAMTSPNGWLVQASPEGVALAVPIKAANAAIRKAWGISVYNIRPVDEHQCPRPEVTVGKNSKGVEYTQLEFWGDGFCALTGERILGIRGVARSDEQFIGRIGEKVPGGIQMMQDLAETARTRLENKITRLLSGVVERTPAEVAACLGIEEGDFIAKCKRGHGFGSSDQRRAQSSTAVQGGADTAELAKRFMAHLVQSFGGNADQAKAAFQECSKFQGDDKKFRFLAGVEDAGKKPKWLDSTIKKWNEQYPEKKF